MTTDQLATLQLVRESMSRDGSTTDGYPAVQPMWRVEGGIESDQVQREELVAVKLALAKLHETEEDAYALVVTLASGRPLRSADEALAALDGLDAVDALVGEMLRDQS